MKYLSVITEGKETTHRITEEQEEKLTSLIREKKLPAHILVNGAKIVSKDILGFTNVPAAPPMPQLRSFADLKAWSTNQPWYQKQQRVHGKHLQTIAPIVLRQGAERI